MKVNVCSATSDLGKNIIHHLQASEVEVIHSARSLNKLKDGVIKRYLDFNDLQSLIANFKADEIVIYIPSMEMDMDKRIKEAQNVVEACQEVGVQKLIAVGFMIDDKDSPFKVSHYLHALRMMINEYDKGVYVRTGMYIDPFIEYQKELTTTKILPYPCGTGVSSFIGKDDLARAIVAVAVTDDNLQKEYLIGSSQLYSMERLAEELSNAFGVQITYQDVSDEEYRQLYHDDHVVDTLVTMYQAVKAGFINEVSDDFIKLLGYEQRTVEQYLSEVH